MNNKKLYKETFDMVIMSDDGLRKVRNMNRKEIKGKRMFRFKTLATVAALAVVFVMSNVITYAATGSTLVEKAGQYIKVSINGQNYDNVKWEKDDKGNLIASFSEDGAEYDITAYTGEDDNMSISVNRTDKEDSAYDSGEESLELTIINANVDKEGDKVYLNIGEGLAKVDITEDFKDGNASGEVEINGDTYVYEVDGTVDSNSSNVYIK